MCVFRIFNSIHFLWNWLNFVLNLNLLSRSSGFFNSCAKIIPDSARYIPVELGKEFTAVCTLSEASVYSADDIKWFMGNVALPRQSYTNLNKSSNLTLILTSDMKNPLKCNASKQEPSYEVPCEYGIFLDKGCKYFFFFFVFLQFF